MSRWIAREDDQNHAYPYLHQQDPTCPTGLKSAIGKKEEDEDEESKVDLIEERRYMPCHFWPEPITETDLIGNHSHTKVHQQERDQQHHPVIGSAPDEECCNPVGEQCRDNDDSEVERNVISKGEAHLLKGFDSTNRKLLMGTGGGTEHLELPDIPGQAIDKCCQLEDGYSSPKDPGEEESVSTQARIRMVRLPIAYRGRCLCLIQVHLGAPCLALLKPPVAVTLLLYSKIAQVYSVGRQIPERWKSHHSPPARPQRDVFARTLVSLLLPPRAPVKGCCP